MSMLMPRWTMNNPLKKMLARDIYITTLGICPLLVVANNIQTGWVMGTVYLSAIMLVSLVLSLIRNLVPVTLRATAIILVSATILSLVHACMQAWFYESSLKLGIYVPLVAMNCLVLVQAEEHALRNPVPQSFLQALVTGTGILLILLVLGTVREYSGLALLQQPPGSFLLLALVIAGIQWFSAREGQALTAT